MRVEDRDWYRAPGWKQIAGVDLPMGILIVIGLIVGLVGRNLFIASGPYGAPRPALDGWLNSPQHRENLFRPEWRTQGIAVQKIAKFGRDRNMTLWVNQFGDE